MKAMGPVEVPTEVLKLSQDNGVEFLADLCDGYFHTNYQKAQWNTMSRSSYYLLIVSCIEDLSLRNPYKDMLLVVSWSFSIHSLRSYV